MHDHHLFLISQTLHKSNLFINLETWAFSKRLLETRGNVHTETPDPVRATRWDVFLHHSGWCLSTLPAFQKSRWRNLCGSYLTPFQATRPFIVFIWKLIFGTLQVRAANFWGTGVCPERSWAGRAPFLPSVPPHGCGAQPSTPTVFALPITAFADVFRMFTGLWIDVQWQSQPSRAMVGRKRLKHCFTKPSSWSFKTKQNLTRNKDKAKVRSQIENVKETGTSWDQVQLSRFLPVVKDDLGPRRPVQWSN